MLKAGAEGAETLPEEISVYTLPSVKQTASGKFLYSTGTSTRCWVMTERVGQGLESRREAIYAY